MDYEQIKIINAVAEYGSFTKAGEVTGYSLPSVSRHVAALEDELGVRLFNRKGKTSLTMTNACRALISYFANAQEEIDNIYSSAAKIRNSASVGMALALSINPFFELDVLRNYISKMPNVSVAQYKISDLECIDYICTGKADIGMFTVFGDRYDPIHERKEAEKAGMTVEALRRSYGVLFFNPRHPLAEAESISMHDLKNYPDLKILFTAKDPIPGLYKMKDAFLADGVGIDIRNIASQTHSDVYMFNQMIHENPNLAFFSQGYVTRNTGNNRVFLRTDDVLQYSTYVIYDPQRITKEGKALIDSIFDVINEK